MSEVWAANLIPRSKLCTVLQVVGWVPLNAGELIFTRITSVPFFTGHEDVFGGHADERCAYLLVYCRTSPKDTS